MGTFPGRTKTSPPGKRTADERLASLDALRDTAPARLARSRPLVDPGDVADLVEEFARLPREQLGEWSKKKR